MSEKKNNLIIFLCSSATLCHRGNPWWGKQPDQGETLFVERFPCGWIHKIWFPSKPIQVFKHFVFWHTHKYWFFSCSQYFNRIRAGAYMQKDSYSHHTRCSFLNPFSGSRCCAQPHLNTSWCILYLFVLQNGKHSKFPQKDFFEDDYCFKSPCYKQVVQILKL